jgi:hypothetical protein
MNMMSRAFGTHGSKYECENLKKERRDETYSCRGEIGYENVDWIQLTQDRVESRSHVNTAVNFGVP